MKARKSTGKDIKVKRNERNAGSKLKMVRVRLKEVIQQIEKQKEEKKERGKNEKVVEKYR